MLQRLVIALTSLLGMVGAVVVAGYLLFFAAGTDQAARAVPAGAAAYATIYLQPSTGQKLNLSNLMTQIPGFADAAGLDQKIHEISARFLGQAGIDYEADVRPWIGNQLSVAAQPGASLADPPQLLLLASVNDQAAAVAAMERIVSGRGLSSTQSSYEGAEVSVAEGLAWTVLEEMLIVAADLPSLQSALDAQADRSPSLADDSAFAAAMRRLPPDHLAVAYLDLLALAGVVDVEEQVAGYSTASAALMVESTGLRLQAVAPFDAAAAPPDVREGFALASEPSSLAEWMPADTQASAVIFGLRRAIETAEEGLAGEPGAEQITSALAQIRALAAFGLGINLDDDLLPLFDAEAAIAASGLPGAAPRGQLLLRPADEGEASAALERVTSAVGEHGGQVTQRDADGTSVTTLEIPQLGALSWAMKEGVIIAGLTFEDVASALAARAAGESLANADRYRAAWELAGARGGNEAFVDIGSIVDASGDALGMTGDARDILLSVGAAGLTAPARDDASEVHMVLTVR